MTAQDKIAAVADARRKIEGLGTALAPLLTDSELGEWHQTLLTLKDFLSKVHSRFLDERLAELTKP